ncbi:MAG: hypothetical protein EBE86_003005 [Hormoscilla sp. GUM202]|nr:hypothetical protein [Hormoscilla sp. GUM202]
MPSETTSAHEALRSQRAIGLPIGGPFRTPRSIVAVAGTIMASVSLGGKVQLPYQPDLGNSTDT